MKATNLTCFLFCGLLIFGCSSNDNQSTTNTDKNGKNTESNVKMPDNFVAMEDFCKKYEDDEEHKKLVGTTVTVTGFVEIVRRSYDTGKLSYRLARSQDTIATSMLCFFEGKDILSKCLPGQKVVVEGVVCDKETSFLTGIENCKLLSVEGESRVETRTTLDIEQGKKFKFADSAGIMTGTVLKVEPDTQSEKNVYVDFECKTPVCVRFHINNHPEAEKIKSLSPGDSIRVFGSIGNGPKRLNYDGKIILRDCELLD